MTAQLVHDSAVTFSRADTPAGASVPAAPAESMKAERPEWSPRGYEILQALDDIFDALQPSLISAANY